MAQPDTSTVNLSKMITEIDSMRTEMLRMSAELDSIMRDWELKNGYEDCANGFYALESTEYHENGNTATVYVKTCMWSYTNITLVDDGTFLYSNEDGYGDADFATGTYSTAQDNVIVLVSDEELSRTMVGNINAHTDETRWVYRPLVGSLYVVEENGLRDYKSRNK